MIKAFEKWPKVAKFLIIFFTLGYFSAIYRIIYYVENKADVMTLIFAILSLIPFIGLIAWICDLVTTVTQNKIALLLWDNKQN